MPPGDPRPHTAVLGSAQRPRDAFAATARSLSTSERYRAVVRRGPVGPLPPHPAQCVPTPDRATIRTMTPFAARPHPMRSLLILSVAALAFALAQTTLIPALGELAEELDTDASGVAWTLTGYLLSAAVCTPIFGRLGDMFGKRRLLVISLGVFAGGLGRRGAGGLARAAGRRPRAPGRRRRHLPALLRDHPRRVPAREGLLEHRPDLGHVRHRRRRGPDHRRRAGRRRLLPLDLLARRRDGRRRRGAHAGADPRVAQPPARPDRRPRRRSCSRVGLALPLLAIARANDVGLGQRPHARADRRRRRDPGRLGRSCRSAPSSRSPTSSCSPARPC